MPAKMINFFSLNFSERAKLVPKGTEGIAPKLMNYDSLEMQMMKNLAK